MVAIRLLRREELKAIPILYRHSPGTILRGRIYIIRADAARALRAAGVKFTVLTRVAGT
jgi:hypothetical protein